VGVLKRPYRSQSRVIRLFSFLAPSTPSPNPDPHWNWAEGHPWGVLVCHEKQLLSEPRSNVAFVSRRWGALAVAEIAGFAAFFPAP
jgi:hypothetical protein